MVRQVTVLATRLARVTIRTDTDQGDLCQVVAVGELDLSNEEQFATALQDVILSGVHAVQVDLGAVTFIDASVVGVLLRCHKLATARGCTLTVTAVSGLPARVLRLTETADILCASPQDAGPRPPGPSAPGPSAQLLRPLRREWAPAH